MLNLSISSFFILSLLFLSLPLHATPASLGLGILSIVVFMLILFISSNLTLAAIFITMVYVSGILILFSYFFSLIQNTKIFIIPLILTISFSIMFLLGLFYWKFNVLNSNFLVTEKFSHIQSILWILNDTKVVIFLMLILLVSMLFIEKIIGLKQKPLRIK